MKFTYTLAALICAHSAFAQSVTPTTAGITGSIPKGGEAQFTHLETGAIWKARESNGHYALRGLAPGDYEVALLLDRNARKLRVRLAVGQHHTLNLDSLNLNPGSATVEVISTAGLATATGLSTEISRDALERIPMDRRTYTKLALLTPGAATSNLPLEGGTIASSGVSFLGMSPRLNTFTLDGLENDEGAMGSMNLRLAPNAVDSYQVLTGSYDVEFGRATGGAVNAISRGGGNRFSGSAYLFHRPETWDAKLPNGEAAPSFSQWQYGATMGGPIVPDKLFWFASVDQFRRSDNKIVAIASPAAAALNAAGFPVVNGVSPFRDDAFTSMLRFDYNLAPGQRLTLRAAHGTQDKGDQTDWGGQAARSIGGARSVTSDAVAMLHQWTLDRVYNEARIQWSRRNQDLVPLDTLGSPSVTILGYASAGTQQSLPQDYRGRAIQVADTLTWTLDQHTVKGGFDLIRRSGDVNLPDFFRAKYIFSGIGPIPNGLAAFTSPNPYGGTGLPLVYLQAWGDPNVNYTVDYKSAFLQDDWKLFDSLTLRAGLRWDHQKFPALQETASYAALRSTSTPVIGPNLGPLRMDRADINADLTPHTSWTSGRVTPRISFDWQLSPTLLLTGGFGVFSGQTPTAMWAITTNMNGQKVKTIVRTAMAGPSPFEAWAQPGHQFNVQPAGDMVLFTSGPIELPKTERYSAGTKWTPTSSLVVTLDFIRSLGSHILEIRDVNAYLPNPYFNTVPATSPNPPVRRPDMRFGNIFHVSSDGQARYWGQILGFHWTGQHAWLQGSYTHSQASDNYVDMVGDVQPQDTRNLSAEWAPSLQNQEHRFVCMGGVDLGHWQVSGVFVSGSGRPYSKLAGQDLNGNADATSDRVGLGPRNTEHGTWTHQADARISYTLGLGGMTKLTALAELFNVFNSTNPTAYQQYVNAPNYSQAINWGPRREWQLGLQFSW